MRLIDANVVYEKGHRVPFHIGIADLCDLKELLEDVPTVDATILPCKIGDEVWGIRRSNKGALAPHRGIVSHMYFAEDMKLCIVVQHICRGEWGEKVFATYEDACAAIREGRSDEPD
jgi:hypothetical protein